MSNTILKTKVNHFLSSLIAKLVEPPPAIIPQDRRRQARFTSTILLAFLIASLLGLLLFPLSYSHDRTYQRALTDPIFDTGLIFLIPVTTGYILSRTRHITAAQITGIIAIAFFPVAVTALPLIAPTTATDIEPKHYTSLLTYLIIPIMFCSAFFPLRYTLIPLLIADAWVVLIGTITPNVSLNTIMPALTTLTVVSALQLVLTHHKDQVDKDRQEALQTLNKALIQSVEEARTATAIAQEANRLKGEFLANVSHELRTPMNAIIGFTGIALSGIGGQFDQDTKHMIQRIEANAKRLLSTINDILDLSKIEAKRLKPDLQPFDARQIVQAMRDQNSSLVDQKNLQFLTTVDPSFPSSVVGDEHLITRIVANLLSNAIKFTDKGHIKLVLSTDASSHTWAIQVADTGIGISATDQQIIFEPFRQVDGSSTRHYGGTGLGLSIVQQLTRAMGGTVDLQSELGKGTSITITFPLLTDNNQPAYTPALMPTPHGAAR